MCTVLVQAGVRHGVHYLELDMVLLLACIRSLHALKLVYGDLTIHPSAI
jgi:hypothetical protein